MKTQYQQDLAALKSKKCTKCKGLGELDDADCNDISFNTWKCVHCNGSGYEPQTNWPEVVIVGVPLVKYEMSDDQLNNLLEACNPVEAIALQCGTPSSPQENANRAWQALGIEMGFKWDTARPYPSEGPKVFTAEPL